MRRVLPLTALTKLTPTAPAIGKGHATTDADIDFGKYYYMWDVPFSSAGAQYTSYLAGLCAYAQTTRLLYGTQKLPIWQTAYSRQHPLMRRRLLSRLTGSLLPPLLPLLLLLPRLLAPVIVSAVRALFPPLLLL